jgi:hypothetical protein
MVRVKFSTSSQKLFGLRISDLYIWASIFRDRDSRTALLAWSVQSSTQPGTERSGTMQGPCPSCCAPCLSGTVSRPVVASSVGNPYALANLLPAGTIQVSIAPHELCGHAHAEDGWHFFESHNLLPHLTTAEDDSFVRQLDFLVSHRFVSATCRLTLSRETLIVRIYVIPFDLANVQGKLRVRDEVRVIAPARRYMKELLPRILQDGRLWEGAEEVVVMGPRRFLAHDIVRDLSLSSRPNG